MEFKNLFNKKEAPEKVHAKIEDLEDQIHQEKMKLLGNEERLKAEMEHVGGIEGLNQKIEKQKKEQNRWIGKTATHAALTMAMYAIFHNNNASVDAKNIALIAMAINGAASIDFGATAIGEWWKVKKSEFLKKEVEAAAV